MRLDVTALGLVPLRLEPCGTWDPAEEYWGEEGDAIDDWARTIIAHGPRPEFEMEQVLPGADPNDPDVDPIIESNDLKDAGDRAGARRILMGLLEADFRCLDAHAHLGNLVFDHTPAEAIRHYEVGVRIGELSLGDNFTGVLGWGLVDNRPGAVTTRTLSPGATSRSTEAANASSSPTALMTMPSGHTIVSFATTPSPYGRRSTSAPSGETKWWSAGRAKPSAFSSYRSKTSTTSPISLPRSCGRSQARRQPLEGLPGRCPYNRVDVSGGAPRVIRDENPRSACPDDDERPSLLAQHGRDHAERLDVLRSKRH